MAEQAQYAEIVSIGEELLSGDSDMIDTNSVFINKALRDIGLRVLYKTTVGDNEQRIIDAIKLALSRADVVITTGGLGPTVDDMTRQGVAGAVGVELEFHQDLLDGIIAKFRGFNSRMSDNNRTQAMLPQGAIPIDNPTGTAPGFIVESGHKAILSMPGVPREMKAMMEKSVVPYLREKVHATGIIKVKVLRTAGIGESLLDERVGEFEKLSNPVVGLAAHTGQTDIRISARAETDAEADALIADLEAKIRERVGSFIFGVNQDSLEGALITALKQRDVRLGIAEYGTKSLLHEKLAAYDKIQLIGLDSLPHGDEADYKSFAEQAAQSIKSMNEVDLVMVVVSDKETAIALATAKEMRSRSYPYSGHISGDPAAEWAVAWAMSMAWHLVTTS